MSVSVLSVMLRGVLCGGLAASVIVKLAGRIDSAVAAAASAVELAMLVAFVLGMTRVACWGMIAASSSALALSFAMPDMHCSCFGEWASPTSAARRMMASLAGALAVSLLVVTAHPPESESSEL